MQRTSCFGLHKDPENDVWWLFQTGKPVNAIGLPEGMLSLRDGGRGFCPHRINLSGPDTGWDYSEIIKSEVFKYLSPVPYDVATKVVYIVADSMRDNLALNNLQKTLSLTHLCHNPVKLIRKDVSLVRSMLMKSNLMRYIVSGVDATSLNVLNALIDVAMYSHGRLIIVGDKIPTYNYQGIVKFLTMEPGMTDKILNVGKEGSFESLGSTLLKKFMRGEYNA